MKSIMQTTLVIILTATANTAAVTSPSLIEAAIAASSDLSNLWPAGTVFPDAIDYVPHSTDLSKRSQWHLYNCLDSGFTGRCKNMDAELDQCYNLVNGWENSISSSGPDKGDVFCVLYSQYECAPSKQQLLLIWPGWTDLRLLGMDDKTMSYRCGSRALPSSH
ncbi:uncharacterized protein RAG0_07005 [Rhynchosporium agropyri]|uniref:Uncharacterized protein n=1 Tax=Rhynchosporium agropyri TaxID=914238 RepID=A0A1E1KJG3_9HELO|nr:uncharacterized protein RAG0_07005 [Rhynchosporium agropyri]